MKTSFGTWLKAAIKEKGISQVELARLIGVQPPQVSHIISGDRGTTPENIVAIARALQLPAEEVFRVAGLLPQNPKTDADDERANHLIQSLKKPSSKQRALDYLQLLIEQEEREERENAAKKNHPVTQPR